ncbi:cytochrome P450 99A2-like [Phragmites australis]|uniref:cytochrome P450 99A2-like n=1 Tax=Phragmites australis TaxID=29695 RepID=UPI002D7827CA|nr:cytochrome P450 99A2-like [Phragmites australis]
MELSAATLISLSLISLPILVTLLSRKSIPSSKKRRPPGPWNLPLVGSLLHFFKSHPQVALRDLANKYGPVMFLRMGQIDTVVISSPAAAQEVLQEKDIIFASRPSLLSSEIFCYGNLDVGFAPYGAYWRTLRKLCTVELLSAKMVRQLAPVRDNETLSLVRKIQAAGQGGEPVNIARLLMSCSNAITAKAAFGQVCSGELQEQFLSAIDVGLKISGGFSFGDLFPSLRFIDVVTGVRRRLWRARWQLDAVFDQIIAQCEAQRGDDLVSVLLRIRDEGELEFPIGTTNIKAIILDMFTGGTETTSSAAEWVMSELMRNPEVMAKAQAEVRRVFDNKSPQDHEGQMDELCYIRMVIKESMRLNPVVPLLVPHLCRETCDVGGFEVTEGTRVMVNAWAMARSPEYWHDAEKFRPERFEDGTIDYKGSRFEYLPFGTGRRRCPGDTFGLAVLELIVARLLYYFDWSLPGGMRPDEINMDMFIGATTRRKNQLHLVASPYKEVRMQS